MVKWTYTLPVQSRKYKYLYIYRHTGGICCLSWIAP